MSHKSECFPYFACSVRDIVWILYPIYICNIYANVLHYRIWKSFLGWSPYVCHFNNSINASVHTHKTHILNIQFGFPGLDIFSTNMLWYSAFAQYPWLSTSLNQGVSSMQCLCVNICGTLSDIGKMLLLSKEKTTLK